MIDKERGAKIKHLPGGILYVWVYTIENNALYSVSRESKLGYLTIDFYGKKKDVKEQRCEIPLGANFSSHDYNLAHFQESNEITVVCIPRSVLKDARLSKSDVKITNNN